jgi:preprotein translocase subunit SecG
VSRRRLLWIVFAIVALAAVGLVLAHVGGGHGIQRLF